MRSSAIIINQLQSLTVSYDSMRSLAGFELAHLIKHHPLEKLVFAGLLGAIALSAPSFYYSVLALPAYASLSRAFTFQADRVGAILSGSPEGLIDLLKPKKGIPKIQTSPWQNFYRAGAECVRRIVHYACDFNPTPAERVARLKNIIPIASTADRALLEKPECRPQHFVDRALNPLYYHTSA